MFAKIDSDLDVYVSAFDFCAIPESEYVVKISGCKKFRFACNKEEYLAFTLTIDEGALKGHRLFYPLRLWSKEKRYERWSCVCLRLLLEAIGVPSTHKGTSEILGKKLVAQVRTYHAPNGEAYSLCTLLGPLKDKRTALYSTRTAPSYAELCSVEAFLDQTKRSASNAASF